MVFDAWHGAVFPAHAGVYRPILLDVGARHGRPPTDALWISAIGQEACAATRRSSEQERITRPKLLATTEAMLAERGWEATTVQAGNTVSGCRSTVPAPVHPRMREEHRGDSRGFRLTTRFILACAGNTFSPLRTFRAMPVHPRTRGEHANGLRTSGLFFGSSPHARGTPVTYLITLIRFQIGERTETAFGTPLNACRSLERRIQGARVGRFKPLCDFEWDWPTAIDRATFEALMTLEFLKDATNALLIGPNGTGKSTLARNLAYEALIHGHTVLFTSAGQLLGELASLDSDSALRRRLRHYAAPTLLIIDEVDYLSYPNRHADLLFELISRRYEQKSTIVTTNRAFKEWREVFPNAACVVSMVDRLMHNAEIVSIEGESYRAKEARERAEQKAKQRRGGKP